MNNRTNFYTWLNIDFEIKYIPIIFSLLCSLMKLINAASLHLLDTIM